MVWKSSEKRLEEMEYEGSEGPLQEIRVDHQNLGSRGKREKVLNENAPSKILLSDFKGIKTEIILEVVASCSVNGSKKKDHS